MGGERPLQPVFGAVAAAGLIVACASTLTPLPPRTPRAAEPGGSPAPAATAAAPRSLPAGTIGSSGLTPSLSHASDPVVRVAVGWRMASASFNGRAPWTLEYAGGGGSIARVPAGETWTIEARGSGLQVRRERGEAQPPRGTTVVLRPVSPDDAILFGGKRYRGELRVFPTDTGLLVLNRTGVEDYLRGVVPLEIGDRPLSDLAAVEAQAITARSYVYVRVRSRRAAQYDILSDVREQVYGGVEAERRTADSAIFATAGLGLHYNGELVDAPYHSTCGGTTAAPAEVWQGRRDVPYLRAISDRVPGSDRFWCDSSASFRWTRTMTQSELTATVSRYLRQYAAGAPPDPGAVRDIQEGPRTNSGRLESVTVVTGRGRYVVRGNDSRFVFRASGDRILNSARYTVALSRDGSGLRSVTFTGSGNGHGVGMCQWGAIGRARAGQTAQQILAAYYVGTSVERVTQADLRGMP